jgi:lipoprotein-anchoring transpeptidase ErfK/SrfK
MLGAALAVGACDRAPPPGASASPSSGPTLPPQAGSPTLPKELTAPKSSALAAAPAAPAGSEGAPSAIPAPNAAPAEDYKGPWLAITASAAGVYGEPSFEGKKLGYLRNGGRVAVEANTVSKKNCTAGWYKLVSGGYVCGNLGTTDLNHPDVKFATQAPNLDEVLPYPYARNAKNGTPLYKSVPSREQMEKYEPYLKAAKDDAATSDAVALKPHHDKDSDAGAAALPARLDAALADAGVALPTAQASADPEPEKPWWQRDDMKDRMNELKLDQLSEDADGVLAKRMVSGFYVAVDKTFRWNGRSWYKTTRGLVTPSDRFWQTTGSKFKGIELGSDWKLPLGFVFGGNKTISSYTIDAGENTIKPAKSYDHFAPVQLTGKEQDFHGTKYAETGDGSWVKRSQIRSTNPGPLPVDLKPNERWIDVNLSAQTLVAFEGDHPIYATLISSGKESKIKDKDHRTPVGEWRIREKHITTTMDGDGTAAGDLPYSIEDVPYVMYFFRSYALHGAFWHANFGTQMSHGCVNLAPLDAKYLFFFADPPLPKGWHGVHASDAAPGSRVVIHL